MPKGTPVPYTWSDQSENGYQQHMATNNKRMKNNGKSKESNDDKKIFICGLPYQTTKETLISYFGQFGTLEDVVVIENPETQRSRGFGFLTFSSQEEVDACQKNRPHTLDGKQLETIRAVPRGN